MDEKINANNTQTVKPNDRDRIAPSQLELNEKIKEHLQHKPKCNFHNLVFGENVENGKCTCGLDDLLVSMSEPIEEKPVCKTCGGSGTVSLGGRIFRNSSATTNKPCPDCQSEPEKEMKDFVVNCPSCGMILKINKSVAFAEISRLNRIIEKAKKQLVDSGLINSGLWSIEANKIMKILGKGE